MRKILLSSAALLVLVIVLLGFAAYRAMFYCDNWAKEQAKGYQGNFLLEPNQTEIGKDSLQLTDRITPYYRELLKCRREQNLFNLF